MKEGELLGVDGNVNKQNMSFKIKPPYQIDNTAVYHVDEEEGVLGRANMCGTITVNNKVTDEGQKEEIISHKVGQSSTSFLTQILKLVVTSLIFY